jgi:transposase
MSSPKLVQVKESLSELKRMYKLATRLMAPRLQMLIEIKKHEDLGGLSKRALAELVGVNHNSIQRWRNYYIKGGIKQLTTHIKNDGRPSILSNKEREVIKAKLQDPKNGLRGYVELLDWVETTFKKEVKYNTLFKYVNREFKAGIKVARKSHIKKDEEAVAGFKKTSFKSAKKPVKKPSKNSKK